MGFLKKSKKKSKKTEVSDVATIISKLESLKPEEEEPSEAEKLSERRMRDAKTAYGLGKIDIERKEYEVAGNNIREALSLYMLVLETDFEEEEEVDESQLTFAEIQAKKANKKSPEEIKKEMDLKKLKKKIADCRMQLGEVALVKEELESARGYFQDALYIYDDRDYADEFEKDAAFANMKLGDVAFREADDEHAKDLYKRAVEVLENEKHLGWADPVIGYIYKLLAELYLDDEQWKECLKAYSMSAGAKKNSESIGAFHPDYAEIMFRWGKALVRYGRHLEHGGEDVVYVDLKDKNPAYEAFKHAKTALVSAEKIFKDLEREDLLDERAEALSLLGICCVKLNQFEDAVVYLDEELKIVQYLPPELRPSEEKQVKSLEYLGSLYLRINPAQAVKVFKSALRKCNCEKYKASDDIVLNIRKLLAKAQYMDSNNEEALKTLKEALVVARRMKNTKLSREYASAEVSRAHNNVELRMFALATKQFETALQIHLKLSDAVLSLQTDNEFVNILIHLGHTHYAANKFDKALGCYLYVLKSAIMKKPDMKGQFQNIHDNLGHIYFGIGDYLNAAKSYKEALLCAESDDSMVAAALLNNLGNVLFHLRAYEDSRHFYLRALNAKKKLSPNKNCVDVANAIFNMGNCCMKLGEFDEAFAFLNKAREIYASINEESLEMAQVCSQIGCLHSLRLEHDDAFRELFKVMIIRRDKLGFDNEDMCSTYLHIANICYSQGQFDKALSFYDSALDGCKGGTLKAAILHSMGNTNTKIDDFETAVKNYREALELKLKLEPVSSSVARTQRNLALLLKDQRRSKALESKDLIDKAIEITHAVVGPNSLLAFQLYMDRASIVHTLDDHGDRMIPNLISAENILIHANFSKVRMRTLSRDLQRAWRKIGGKPANYSELMDKEYAASSSHDKLKDTNQAIVSESEQESKVSDVVVQAPYVSTTQNTSVKSSTSNHLAQSWSRETMESGFEGEELKSTE